MTYTVCSTAKDFLMGTPKDSEETRARLIEAAGKLFAEKGFNAVTVREIAKAAETHLSALNYHFRSKEELYRAVLRKACALLAITAEDEKRLGSLKPTQALNALITEWIKAYQDPSATGWQSVILTRECGNPSNTFPELLDTYFKPQIGIVAGVIGRAVSKPGEDFQVRFAAISLVGMLDTLHLYTDLVDGVAPGLPDYLRKKDRLVRQLVATVTQIASTPTVK